MPFLFLKIIFEEFGSVRQSWEWLNSQKQSMHIVLRQIKEYKTPSDLVVMSHMPDGHCVVVHVFVYGQIWRLVDFSRLQYQHLGKDYKTGLIYDIISFARHCFPSVLFFFFSHLKDCEGSRLCLAALTGNRTEDTSFLVASTRKSIQKSITSSLGAGCSTQGFLKCW